MPIPEEICTITIDGQEYRDWKTVQVMLEFPGLFRRFQLSVSEQSPTPDTLGKAQIKPGQKAEVRLGGELAVTGYVYERQTAMDSGNHAVQITGQSLAGDTTRSNIDISKLGNGGQFEKKSLVEIATELLKPYGRKVVTGGDTSRMNEPIDDFQVRTGETPFQAIERLARLKGVFIGDNVEGDYSLYGGLGGQTATPAKGAALIEGENIQWMRVTVTDLYLANPYITTGQAAGDDQYWGKKVAQREFRVAGKGMDRYKPAVIPMERGLSRSRIDLELKRRLEFEIAWRLGTQIQAEIGVYGWHKPEGGLWRAAPDELVYVHAPSAMVQQELAVQKLVFSQDVGRGTLTTLQLINKERYFGQEVQV